LLFLFFLSLYSMSISVANSLLLFFSLLFALVFVFFFLLLSSLSLICICPLLRVIFCFIFYALLRKIEEWTERGGWGGGRERRTAFVLVPLPSFLSTSLSFFFYPPLDSLVKKQKTPVYTHTLSPSPSPPLFSTG